MTISTSGPLCSTQSVRYADFYSNWSFLRSIVRFDIRYRCNRLLAYLRDRRLDQRSLCVLDMGFGGGDILRCLPKHWSITGAEISASAVKNARGDERFGSFRRAHFVQIAEDDPDTLPPGPFDLIISSHVLEHVPNESATLAALRARLAPDGLLLLYVPIEEPDYIRFHRRNYSLQSIADTVARSGFDLVFVEGSMHINGHLWKLITVPSRREWPLLGPVVDAFRCSTLSLLPYGAVRMMDFALDALGFGARQAFVVAKRNTRTTPFLRG